jgi:hypothetical protein
MPTNITDQHARAKSNTIHSIFNCVFDQIKKSIFWPKNQTQRQNLANAIIGLAKTGDDESQ